MGALGALLALRHGIYGTLEVILRGEVPEVAVLDAVTCLRGSIRMEVAAESRAIGRSTGRHRRGALANHEAAAAGRFAAEVEDGERRWEGRRRFLEHSRRRAPSEASLLP